MTRSYSADKKLFKRLVISFNDIHDAERYAKRLLCVGPFSAAQAVDGTSHEALQVALIVAYARPFSRNYKAPDVEPDLPAALFVDTLEPRLRKLHDRIVHLRDKEFAHSDPEPADVNVFVTSHPTHGVTATAVNSVSATKARIPDDDLRVIVELIELHLWRITNEKGRINDLLTPGVAF